MTNGHIPVSSVVFREDLYPRIEKSPTTVQKYAEDLTVLPPIEVNQDTLLIDGWHRWAAHKKAGEESIQVIVTETTSDAELLELAIRRNATSGQQLSNRDKKKMAARIYRGTAPEERGAKKQRLAEILSVSHDTVRRWLSRIDKDSEEERNAAILNLYLQCYTAEQIADATGTNQKTVESLFLKIRNYEISGIPGLFTEDAPPDDATDKVKREWEAARQRKIIEHNQACAEHSFEFSRPIYNVWKQQEKSEGSEHPRAVGNDAGQLRTHVVVPDPEATDYSGREVPEQDGTQDREKHADRAASLRTSPALVRKTDVPSPPQNAANRSAQAVSAWVRGR